MKTETITIHDVNVAKLDQQRLTLATIPDVYLNVEQQVALGSIQSMLDEWSDQHHFKYQATTTVEGRYADDSPYPEVANVTGNVAGLLALRSTIPDDAESIIYSGLTFFEHASITFRDMEDCEDDADLATYDDRWSIDKLIVSRTEAQLVYMSAMHDTRFIVTITRR